MVFLENIIFNRLESDICILDSQYLEVVRFSQPSTNYKKIYNFKKLFLKPQNCNNKILLEWNVTVYSNFIEF